MIKPEDIPDCMRLYFEQLRDGDGFLIAEKQIVWMTNPQLADVANFLIASGIVSPAVWAVRNTKTGRLASHPMTRLKDLVPDKKEPLVDGWEYEHWKGQTE